MIGKIAKAVLKLLLPDVTEHLLQVFKLEKVLAYVELPNEADRGVLKLQDELNMVKGELKDMAKDIHPPAIDLKELDEMRNDLKKIRNMKVFKKLG